ncbi:hypothetical protein D6851_02460 [Altericroceibacterium spongiae]|uniref:HIRAN domain-containing protein n=1 Tax=Altericroceibacterium spongiae TaxID=2320269 RepID=A0A420ERM6_9SPHN|nr:HIRAN domain-containing protein [Altericroceibacterium spongiae]RKF23354.1 hypothetical protein D6851_02460 [Altericroceibacterium spongiae]
MAATQLKRPRKKIFQLVGESFDNPDGTSRQTILLSTDPGEPAYLRRDPDNPKDPNAIAVLDALDRQLAHIAAEDAAILAPLLDSGDIPRAKIHQITGGLRNYPTMGCEISLAWEGQKPHRHRPLQEDQAAWRKAQVKKRLKTSSTGCLGMILPAAFLTSTALIATNWPL